MVSLVGSEGVSAPHGDGPGSCLRLRNGQCSPRPPPSCFLYQGTLGATQQPVWLATAGACWAALPWCMLSSTESRSHHPWRALLMFRLDRLYRNLVSAIPGRVKKLAGQGREPVYNPPRQSYSAGSTQSPAQSSDTAQGAMAWQGYCFLIQKRKLEKRIWTSSDLFMFTACT